MKSERAEYHHVCDCTATQFRALYPVKTKNGVGVYDGRYTMDEDWAGVRLA